MRAARTVQLLKKLTRNHIERQELVATVINSLAVEKMVEIGVWRGGFAEAILSNCPAIKNYYMIDPWRQLNDWRKPLNVSDNEFEAAYQQAMQATEHAADRRTVLRGTTLEVVESIEDKSLELAYIDGDHTLRGILIDLIKIYPKISVPGLIIGDDFTPNIWQHGHKFEPTLVFPTAIYFAEVMGDTFVVLPRGQFAIVKTPATQTFAFHDPNNRVKDISVLGGMSTMK